MKLLVFMILLVVPINLLADDPGISKVRIIQTGEKTYFFETDISETLLWTLQDPIFPDRFEVSEPLSLNEAGWVTIRINFSTEGEPLSENDEIILPWTRNAVDVSMQWLDGGSFKGLYYRKLKGIHIPIAELVLTTKTTTEVVSENFKMGWSHFPFNGVHILFVIALVLFIPSKKVFEVLLFMTVGQMLALLTVALDLSFADLLYSDLLLVLLTLIIALCLAYKKQFNYLGIALMAAGFIHATAYVHDSHLLEKLPTIQKVQGVFAFNIAMDLGHYALAFIALSILKKTSNKVLNIKRITIVVGSLSVFLMLLLGNEYVLKGEHQILKTNESSNITYDAPGGASTQQEVKRGSAEMTTPIMVFLSVEPYEVRQEILVMGRAANKLLNFNLENESDITIEKQESIKEELLALIIEADSTLIDNKLMKATEASANFVTLGPGGVAIREGAIEENIDEALIGVSLLYEFEGFPEKIQSQWKVFPDDVKYIEYQAVDPHATSTRIISKEENSFVWETKMKGYKIKEIEPIEAEPTPRPLISYVLWFVMLLLFVLSTSKRKVNVSKIVLVVLLLAGFVCYPFVRTTSSLPFIPEGIPSVEKSEVVLNDLLTNVYRAFDRRNEDAVYDRLALSVTEDQLSAIYLQNRQSMAIENRGGARANVDEVAITELYEVNRAENYNYVSDVEWTVRGSVNHYGHTHYRQNQYRAFVTFLIEDGVWKISKFEILDTQRLY